MKKVLFLITCTLFTYSVSSQNLEKLLDEAKKVVNDDSCIFLKDFSVSLPAKDANAKIPIEKFSFILNKNTKYSIYLFKSNVNGEAELSIEKKEVLGEIPTIKVPSGKTYSSIYFDPKVEGVYHLFFKNQSDNQQDLIGVLSIPKTKVIRYRKEYHSNTDYYKADTTAYNVVDEMPQFIIGEDNAFMKWFFQHFKYPEKAKKEGIYGKVYAQFIVDKLGKIRNIRIIRSVDPYLDEAVINTLKEAPLWQKPGILNGENVNVIFTLPVNIKLTK